MDVGTTKKTDTTIKMPCSCDRETCHKGWLGTWIGGKTGGIKNDQVLEIRTAYEVAIETCRDCVRLLTYGQIMEEGREKALEHVRGIFEYHKGQITEIIDWFIGTVDKNWAPKRKPLAQYLAEVIRGELRGRYDMPPSTEGWAMIMQLTIDKYEKGITNEDQAKAKPGGRG